MPATVLHEDALSPDIAKKIMAFRRITDNIRKINETEPLSPEFDEILSRRVHFNTAGTYGGRLKIQV